MPPKLVNWVNYPKECTKWSKTLSILLLTRVMVFLSWRQSLLSNDSVISGMVVMRFSDMADLERLLSSEEERRALWWCLISQFSSFILRWLGVGAIMAACSLFNFMASNCDCRPQRKGQHALWHNVNTLFVHKSTRAQRKTVMWYLHQSHGGLKSGEHLV